MRKGRLKVEQAEGGIAVIRMPKWCLYLGIVGGGI